MTPRLLLPSFFCCPDCKGELRALNSFWTPSGRLKSGTLACSRCQAVAGQVRNFKYDFVHLNPSAKLAPALSDANEAIRQVLPWEIAEETVRHDDPRIQCQGAWEAWDERYRMSHGVFGSALEFRGEFLDIGVRLLKHPWSGLVDVEIDGRQICRLDLYAPKWSTIHWFPLAFDLAPGEHEVRILPTGEKNSESAAAQVFFHEFVITRPAVAGDDDKPAPPANRVLPVFPDVEVLMKKVAADGLILDCGSGDRALGDPRCIALDFEQYQLPDVYADVLKLPFPDNVFDLVFSQAVLEHVRDPFQAVEEMRRITKPGGTVWAGMAFMQPVHAVPSHYFNATVWGMEELFRNYRIVQSNWFGELSFTVDWLYKTAGVAEKADPAEYAELMGRIKALDKLVSHQELRGVASGVSVEAVKI